MRDEKLTSTAALLIYIHTRHEKTSQNIGLFFFFKYGFTLFTCTNTPDVSVDKFLIFSFYLCECQFVNFQMIESERQQSNFDLALEGKIGSQIRRGPPLC